MTTVYATSVRKGALSEPTQVEVIQRYDTRTFIRDIGVLFLESWFLMLCVGGLHSSHAQVPLLSYGDSVTVLFIVSLIGTAAGKSQRIWRRGR
jgi:hypothetical protein